MGSAVFFITFPVKKNTGIIYLFKKAIFGTLFIQTGVLLHFFIENKVLQLYNNNS